MIGGSGTPGSPYQIADLYGLQGAASSSLLGNSFILTNNINAAGTSTWNSGAGFVPIGNSVTAYTGQFNGAGYTIDQLTINRSTDYLGLFGVIGNGASAKDVFDLGITNAAITGQSGADYIGILAGSNAGAIETSYTTGSVTSANSATYVGGLIGENIGTILNAYNQANISGGSSSDFIGGAVGYNSGSIDKIYNSGTVSATGTNLGRLVGKNNGGTVTNSYYDTTIGGSVVGSDGGLGRTTTEMQTQVPNFYVSNGGWDFSTPIWRFNGSNTYPILNVFDPTTFMTLSGTAPSGVLDLTDNLRLVLNGTLLTDLSLVAGDNFTFQIPFGTINPGDSLLFYIDNTAGNTVFGNTYHVAPGGNISALSLALPVT